MLFSSVTGVEKLTVIASVVTLIGLPATLLALYLGWAQLRRTETAAEAARKTGEAVRDQLQSVQLSWLLPRFLETEAELEDAQDAATALRALSQWRGVAPQGEAILSKDTSAHPGLAEELRTTVGLAVSAQQSLREGVDTREALRVVMPAISNCAHNIAVHVASVSLSFGPGPVQ